MISISDRLFSKDLFSDKKMLHLLIWTTVTIAIFGLVTYVLIPKVFKVYLCVVGTVFTTFVLFDFTLRYKNNHSYPAPLAGFGTVFFSIGLLLFLSNSLVDYVISIAEFEWFFFVLLSFHIFFSSIILFICSYVVFPILLSYNDGSKVSIFELTSKVITKGFIFCFVLGGLITATFGVSILQKASYPSIKEEYSFVENFSDISKTYEGTVLTDQIELYRSILVSSSLPSFYFLLKDSLDNTKNSNKENKSNT